MMETISGDEWIKTYSKFIKANESQFGQVNRNNSNNNSSSLLSWVGLDNNTSTSTSTTPSTSTAALLRLDPHHLFYLLIRFEALGLNYGQLDVRAPRSSRPISYFSFISPNGDLTGKDKDDTMSISSYRSTISSTVSAFSLGNATTWLGGLSSSSIQTDPTKDLKLIYSAFTRSFSKGGISEETSNEGVENEKKSDSQKEEESENAATSSSTSSPPIPTLPSLACCVESLTKLERIDLRGNQIEEPQEIGRLAVLDRVQEVWCKRNPLEEEFPDWRVDIFVEFAKEGRKMEGLKGIKIDDELPGYLKDRESLRKFQLVLSLNLGNSHLIQMQPLGLQSDGKKFKEKHSSNEKFTKKRNRRIVDLDLNENQSLGKGKGKEKADGSEESDEDEVDRGDMNQMSESEIIKRAARAGQVEEALGETRKQEGVNSTTFIGNRLL
ncbi:hypothetical protein L7F22_061216 [Adiantum nelumboides]|nr:hypothetical protein [Adiantum nelumboides]